MPDDKLVVREWEIPIPPELDKTSGISAKRVMDSYVMTFTGTTMDLCIMAAQLLRTAGVKSLQVKEVLDG
jgi:hypothetical protein